MSGFHVVTNTLLAVVTLGTTTIAHAVTDDASLRTDLERIAQRRIFFGHQSVGMNLLDGVKQLTMKTGVSVRVAKVETASGVEPAMIGHTLIAENGDPLRKLKSFEQAMGMQSTGLDIALNKAPRSKLRGINTALQTAGFRQHSPQGAGNLPEEMKFCYVDFTAETNVQALFASYRATMDGLRARNPGTAFVHVTAPLTIVQGGLKAQIKQFFGYAPLYGTLENMRREEFNALLRQTYQGHEPVFDLARIESTSPDGAAETVKWKGSVVPAMAPAYTDDGGHLNAAGRLRAARELVSVLASIPDRPSAR